MTGAPFSQAGHAAVRNRLHKSRYAFNAQNEVLLCNSIREAFPELTRAAAMQEAARITKREADLAYLRRAKSA